MQFLKPDSLAPSKKLAGMFDLKSEANAGEYRDILLFDRSHRFFEPIFVS